jgi:hypothetical protein
MSLFARLLLEAPRREARDCTASFPAFHADAEDEEALGTVDACWARERDERSRAAWKELAHFEVQLCLHFGLLGSKVDLAQRQLVEGASRIARSEPQGVCLVFSDHLVVFRKTDALVEIVRWAFDEYSDAWRGLEPVTVVDEIGY